MRVGWRVLAEQWSVTVVWVVVPQSSEALASVIGNPRVFAIMKEAGVLSVMAELAALDAGPPTEMAARTLYFTAKKNGRGNRPLFDEGVHKTMAM